MNRVTIISAVPAVCLTLSILLASLATIGQKKMTGQTVSFAVEKRVKSTADTSEFIVTSSIQKWNPAQTAIIICDMWDVHWCKGATSRVAEMAPALNRMIASARQKGMLIVHAPSSVMDHYSGTPERHLALKYDQKRYEKLADNALLPSEQGAVWPIDQSDEGCDDSPQCTGGSPWRKQIDAITIVTGDVVSDSGAEMAALFEQKGIKNVILTGVHTNMCVIGRSFGLRSMVRMGKNVVLMRDMTDAMYNSRMPPKVDHFTGVDLVVEYIEKYVCGTILSTDLVSGKPFKFSEDKRHAVAALAEKNK